LRDHDVRRVAVLGLATDYCVKFTAADALVEGFETDLILSGCRGVELRPGDSERAVSELRAAGAGIHPALDAWLQAQRGGKRR